MSQAAVNAALFAVAPEVEGPAMLAQHASSIATGALVAFAILLVLVGIIVISTAKHKTSGYLLSLFGCVLGGGALYASAAKKASGRASAF